MPIPKVMADAIAKSREHQNPYTASAQQLAFAVGLSEDAVTKRLKQGNAKFHGVKIRFVRDKAVQGSPYRLHRDDIAKIQKHIDAR